MCAMLCTAGTLFLLGDTREIISRQTLQVSAVHCMQSKYHADSNPESKTFIFILVGRQGHVPGKTKKLHLTGAEQPKQQVMLLNSSFYTFSQPLYLSLIQAASYYITMSLHYHLPTRG